MNTQQLENELWEAADQLRANSKLTASEYSMPVLGLIFLRHADNRFKAYLPEIEADIPSRVPTSRREALIKLGFQGRAAIYLPEQARFDRLATLPQGAQVGEAVDAAMDAIEADYDVLKGALPRGYTAFEPALLAELIKIFDRPAIKSASGDVFGRIYEYFLNKFAQSGAQEGGEFFTPPSLVRMIVNVIEPDHGLVLDPACGSAGMFVQTGHFIEGMGATTNDRATFHGQEKSDTNTKLARMNMVVHGLDASNIRQGNTFYDQVEGLIGQCDFVMANPPFNVDGVITSRIGNQVDPKGRLPFGLPGVNGKTGAISNANSLWIQYFYAYLNEHGRAGFVMASSASDAGNKDRDIREQLVRSGHVDVMMAIGNKFFYTRSLPCTLWFFDKGKSKALLDQVLMIDARNVYTVVSARSHVFTDEQLANLSAITWLYRGERDKFIGLVGRYQQQVDHWLAGLPARLAADDDTLMQLAVPLQNFARHATLAELNANQPDEAHVSAAQLKAFKAELADAQAALKPDHKNNPAQQLHSLLQASAAARKAIAKTRSDQHNAQVKLQATLDPLAVQLKAGIKLLETRHKRWLTLLEQVEKTLRARQSPAWDGKLAREFKRRLLAADEKKHEAPTVRDEALQALRQAAYFIHQVHWLHSRFPDACFVDVPGLCKAVPIAGEGSIESNDWSLTPGRYVGVAVVAEDDEEEFDASLRAIHVELAELNEKAAELAERIGANFEALLG